MKTLADLKRDSHKYEWSLTFNSWYASQPVPEYQIAYRKVSRVQSSRLALITIKDGIEKESWMDFPKASELTIRHNGLSSYTLTFKRIIPANPNMQRAETVHTMEYQLRPILELFAA
jgi:hypothetical protein